MEEEREEVDEVVVDRAWSEDIKSSIALSDAGAGVSPEKSDGHHPHGASLDHESMVHQSGFWAIWTPLTIIRWRFYPFILDFFSSRFFDVGAEERYLKENWFMRKVCHQVNGGGRRTHLTPCRTVTCAMVIRLLRRQLGVRLCFCRQTHRYPRQGLSIRSCSSIDNPGDAHGHVRFPPGPPCLVSNLGVSCDVVLVSTSHVQPAIQFSHQLTV